MGDPIRLFIGIGLPEDIQNRLVSLEDYLKRFIPKARWVKTDNLHITLKFLGSCDADSVEGIDIEIKKVSDTHKSFYFRLNRLGAFPKIQRARVLWAGIGDGFDRFVDLAENVDSSLESLGFKRESRTYHPHVTIARLKTPFPIDQTRLSEVEIDIPDTRLEASSIILFQSLLSPQGAEYINVKENYLRKS